MNDRFHLMSVFVAVAEEEGFAAAARRLGMSPPAVTRAITALEKRLGTQLLTRTTRFVRATDAGQRYLEDARRVLADADAADAAVAGIVAKPTGDLTLTAPVLFGQRYVLPHVLHYLERYPEVNVACVFLDRVVNLLEEGFDVAVRIGELPDSEIRAIRLGSVRQVVCCAPAYLARYGKPVTPDDLREHVLVAPTGSSAPAGWQFRHGGKARTVRVKPRLSVSSNSAAVESAVAGFGITRLLSYQVADEVASGKLQLLLEPFEPLPRPIHLVHRAGRTPPAKIRALLDLLTQQLRGNPALDMQTSVHASSAANRARSSAT